MKKFHYVYSTVWLAHDWMKEDKVIRNVNHVDSDLPIDEFVDRFNSENTVWHEHIHKIKEGLTHSQVNELYDWFVS